MRLLNSKQRRLRAEARVRRKDRLQNKPYRVVIARAMTSYAMNIDEVFLKVKPAKVELEEQPTVPTSAEPEDEIKDVNSNRKEPS